jgi:hypothetical protein
LNYIYSGTEINLIVAIDFTNSNGNPYNTEDEDNDNLHNLDLSNLLIL